MTEYERGYADGRAGRDSAALGSTDRDEYLRGYDIGNDDRRTWGWDA